MKKEKCEYCDGTLSEKIIRIPFHYKKQVVYIDNVPVRVCDKCGELYFEAKVYRTLEKIAESSKKIRTRITFPLADYRTARLLNI